MTDKEIRLHYLYFLNVGMLFKFNPGVFWNHIDIVLSLCFSFICCPITTKLDMIALWHKISEEK